MKYKGSMTISSQKPRCLDTYKTVPITASGPEYGAKTFHVKDKESSIIERALQTKTSMNKLHDF